jgi:surfactin family lipopeptide synthetase A
MPSTAITEAERSRLSQYLSGLRSDTSSGPIRHQSSQSPAPLSVSQEEIWRLAQQPGLPPVFNESVTIYRHGPLQVAALESAFTEVIRRHEAWRTTFDVVDGEPVQVAHPASRMTLPVTDLRELPETERLALAIQMASENAQHPFDMRRGPLVRAKLIRLGDDEYRLFLSVHMIVLDGVSIYHVLLPELRALYDTYAADKPSPLPELPIQVSDFARWQRAWLQGENLRAQVEYWKKQLAGEPLPLQWPVGRRPPKQTFRGAIDPFTLSGKLAACARELSKSEGVTLFATLTATLACLLHGYTRQEDLAVGTFSPSGRKRSEVKNLLGYFLNPVALRFRLNSGQTFRQLMLQAREVSSEAFSNDDVSFEQLVTLLRPKVDPSRNPFFQVALSHDPPLPDVGPEWDVTPMDVNGGGARWDLYIAFDARLDRIIVRAQYNPDLFDRETIGRLVFDFGQLLEAAAAAPQQTLGKLILSCNLRCAA